jgi:hypothetical protein
VVYFVRQVLGLPVVSPEVLRQSTEDYRGWVEAYARNHHIPIEWAEKGVRKEDYVFPPLHRLDKQNVQRDGSRYAYRLTPKGVEVALLFLFFHKRLCGPLANSRFHHAPDPAHAPHSKLESAYYKADKAIQKMVVGQFEIQRGCVAANSWHHVFMPSRASKGRDFFANARRVVELTLHAEAGTAWPLQEKNFKLTICRHEKDFD